MTIEEATASSYHGYLGLDPEVVSTEKGGIWACHPLMVVVRSWVCGARAEALGSWCSAFRAQAFGSGSGLTFEAKSWLWVYYIKLPIYPIFYLLKGDYDFGGYRVQGFQALRHSFLWQRWSAVCWLASPSSENVPLSPAHGPVNSDNS